MTGDRAAIRSAASPDAAGIARVHVDSWRETYSGLMPERFFDEDAFERRRRMWDAYLALEVPYGTLVVAESDERVVGFAFSGPAQDDDATRGHGPVRELHLFAIYLLKSEHGKGTGRALLEAATAGRPAQLWVASENALARAFYERNGVRADGVEVVDPDVDGLVEIRMVR
jgi:ribosomal protein S18 acetylase RimI-like enzyme